MSAILTADNAHAQASTRRITVDYPRALAVAADQLRRSHKAAISYEDAPYEHPNDVVDVTQLIRRDLDKYPAGTAPKVIVPRMCRFETEYTVDPVTGEPTNMYVAVRQVVDAYNTGSNPGKFRVEETVLGPCIIPTHVMDLNGHWKIVTSILDHPISLALTNVSNHIALRHLVSAIESNTQEKIVCSAIMQERGGITLIAEQEPARSVLVRLLTHEGYGQKHNYWQLLFQPQPREYNLNLYFATGLPYTYPIPTWAAAMRTSTVDRLNADRE